MTDSPTEATVTTTTPLDWRDRAPIPTGRQAVLAVDIAEDFGLDLGAAIVIVDRIMRAVVDHQREMGR